MSWLTEHHPEEASRLQAKSTMALNVSIDSSGELYDFDWQHEETECQIDSDTDGTCKRRGIKPGLKKQVPKPQATLQGRRHLQKESSSSQKKKEKSSVIPPKGKKQDTEKGGSRKSVIVLCTHT